ncbi:MAG: hypothetical protein IPG96_01390 [Proteobacteria bacterium]|nr:hypothetical protein [Pseudomonadota bacterium]
MLNESNELNNSLSRSYQVALPLTPDAGVGHGDAGLRADAGAARRFAPPTPGPPPAKKASFND